MSVVVETTLGDITIDLYTKKRPRACLNFLKLCKIKYYNYNLFHTVSRGFIAQTGDPTGKRTGGESIFGVLDGPLKRYFEPATNPRIKHTVMGLVSFVGNEDKMVGSQFFFTLGADLTYLDDKHCVFGEVVEGLDVLEIINEAICDTDDRPYQDIRVTHTVVLDDPFPDPDKMRVPSRSPSPSAERLQGGRIAPDEEIDETAGKTTEEVNELLAEREAKARATILEMVGDLPDAEMAPPENVLFICKLNPVTNDDDLEIIFSRFGKIKSCEVIRDKKSGDSLQYAFVEFEEQKSCEDAYFKMDNVLIDDRRIHVDFSQSVAKVRWLGKGRGVRNFGEKDNDLGKGHYQKGSKRDKPKEEVRYEKENRRRYDDCGRRDDGSRSDKDYYRRDYGKTRDLERRDKHGTNSDRYQRNRSRSRSPRHSNYDKKYKDRNRKKSRSRSPISRKERKKYREEAPNTPNIAHKKKERKLKPSNDDSDSESVKTPKKQKHKKKKRKESKSSDSDSEPNSKHRKKSKKKKRRRGSSESS